MGYDPQRTGRHPASGQIKEPRLAWQMDFSDDEYFLTAKPESGEMDWELGNQTNLKPLSREAQRAWGMIPAQMDVVGDGNLVDPPGAPGARWGKHESPSGYHGAPIDNG